MRRYTVASLTAELEALLRDRYPSLWVEGEVGSLTVAGSGHCYVTLRDQGEGYGQRGATLGAVCWRDTWRNLAYRPRQGDRVVCRGRLGVYGPRGVYQLQIHDIQPAGKGDLAREIAERVARLTADGLLDPARKRPLPRFPRFVGVATSLTGAALQDFLKVSRARFPAARVLVAGCQVQGEAAPGTVIEALALLVEDGRSDVVVVTRGGGSKEDLLPFQDEALARAIAACPIPVVSAVGHQVDTTIADLVADAVAPTPTAAAVRVLPDGPALAQGVDEWDAALRGAMGRGLERRRERVEALRARLRHPGQRLAEVRRRATDLEVRLQAATRRHLRDARQRVQRLEAELGALSPLAVLGRGYAIVSSRDGVVTRADEVAAGDRLDVRVHDGRFDVEVV